MTADSKSAVSTRTLKVYGLNVHGTDFDGGTGQRHAIVAARSKTEAARLFNVSRYEMNRMGHETGNEVQCAVALAQPGVVFIQTGDCSSRSTFTSLWPARIIRNHLTVVED